MPDNTLLLVEQIVRTLSDADIKTWILGGWAEELRGICSPRSHNDIDLLYPADEACLSRGKAFRRDRPRLRDLLKKVTDLLRLLLQNGKSSHAVFRYFIPFR